MIAPGELGDGEKRAGIPHHRRKNVFEDEAKPIGRFAAHGGNISSRRLTIAKRSRIAAACRVSQAPLRKLSVKFAIPPNAELSRPNRGTRKEPRNHQDG